MTALAERRRRFATPRSIFALFLREMATNNARSPGGYAWLVIEPLAGIAVLSIAFSLALRSPSLGTNFPFFYATGYLPFFFFQQTSNRIARTLTTSKGLLTFPAVTFFDAIAAAFLFNLVSQLLVSFLIIGGISMYYALDPVISPGRILNTLGMLIVLTAGIGVLNCYLFTTFPAYARIWGIVTRPLVLISGIFFIYEDTPEGLGKYLLWNPLMHITAEMRAGFYGTYEAAYVVSLFPYGLGAVTLFLGLLLLYRHHDEILWK